MLVQWSHTIIINFYSSNIVKKREMILVPEIVLQINYYPSIFDFLKLTASTEKNNRNRDSREFLITLCNGE